MYENGVRQSVAFFGAATIPVDLALLLDVSASMTDKMSFLQQAAVGFVRTLRPQDRGSVIGFNGRVQVLQPLTRDISQLETAVQRAPPGGSTALYDALYITLKQLARERKAYDQVRRQVIAVFTDGQDTASLISGDDVLAAARRTGVTIYTIRLESTAVPDQSLVVRHPAASETNFILKRLSQDTGGRAFFPRAPEELGGVYAEIAAEIAHQYALAYTPEGRPSDGKFRQVIVRIVSRSNVKVRTRPGYYAVGDR